MKYFYILSIIFIGIGLIFAVSYVLAATGIDIDLSALFPPCTSAPNACGYTNSGVLIGGSCSAIAPSDSLCLPAPPNPVGYGNACASVANICGQTNSGTIQCDGSCSATVPSNPVGYGNACTSVANICGQTNSGTIQCDGSCSAITPSDSLCNQPPEAINLDVTDNINYCSFNLAEISLSWQFDDVDAGDSQSAYKIELTRLSDNESCTLNGTGNTSNIYAPSINNTCHSFINYDLSESGYTWKVKVWDQSSIESAWSSPDTFNTPKHQYPLIDFSWSPSNPSQDEEVVFTDDSTVYGVSSKSAWVWTFTDGNPASLNEQNPTTQFNSTGDKQVTLEVTDSDGYSCSISKTVNIQLELPQWQED